MSIENQTNLNEKKIKSREQKGITIVLLILGLSMFSGAMRGLVSATLMFFGIPPFFGNSASLLLGVLLVFSMGRDILRWNLR